MYGKRGFQAEIIDTGYIGLMKDEMRMGISLFMSDGGVIMANYFVEDAYLCTITLVPTGDDLEVTVSGGGERLNQGWTRTNMPVLISPEDLAIWGEESFQK
jgi:hypothetical protein